MHDPAPQRQDQPEDLAGYINYHFIEKFSCEDLNWVRLK